MINVCTLQDALVYPGNMARLHDGRLAVDTQRCIKIFNVDTGACEAKVCWQCCPPSSPIKPTQLPLIRNFDRLSHDIIVLKMTGVGGARLDYGR